MKMNVLHSFLSSIRYNITSLGLIVLSGCSVSFTDNSLRGDIKGNFSKKYQTEGTETYFEGHLRGSLKFDESETTIIQFPNKSRLNIHYQAGNIKKQLLIETESNEEPSYHYSEQGEKASFDHQGEKWFASVIPYLFRVTGFNYEKRIARMKHHGGITAVLHEIALIRSDYIRGLYLRKISEKITLLPRHLNYAIELIENIQSDRELANVLLALSKTQEFAEEQWNNLVGVSRNIQSDREMANLYIALVDSKLKKSSVLYLIEVAGQDISSDAELGRTLRHIAKVNALSDGLKQAIVFQAKKSIQSKKELEKVLAQLNSH